MGDTDQMDERVARRQLPLKRRAIQSVATHRDRAGNQLPFRARTHQGADGVPARQQLGNQTRADVAGAAGEEDVSPHVWSTNVTRCRMGWDVGTLGCPTRPTSQPPNIPTLVLPLERVAQLHEYLSRTEVEVAVDAGDVAQVSVADVEHALPVDLVGEEELRG